MVSSTTTTTQSSPRASDAASDDSGNTLRPNNLRGALWILGAAVISTGMIYFVRLAAAHVPPVEVAFFRGAFGVVIILPIVLRTGLSGFKSKQIHFQIARGLNGALILSIGFYTMTVLPLAQLTSISFSRPLFVLVLAAIFLGEKLKAYRAVATVIGFIGIVIIVQPGTHMHPAALLALLTAFLIAVNLMFVKLLTRTDRTETLIFYSAFIQAVVLAIPTAIWWVTPSWDTVGYLVGVAVCGTLMQTCVVRGYRIAEASAVAPFDYTRLLFSGLLGYFVYTEIPDEWIWLGAPLVIVSTLYVVRKEAQVARDARLAAGESTAP